MAKEVIEAQVLLRTVGRLVDGTTRVNPGRLENAWTGDRPEDRDQGPRVPVMMEFRSWKVPRHGDWEGRRYLPMGPFRGPGKTTADAGMGSCLDMCEQDYERFSASIGQQRWAPYAPRYPGDKAISPAKQKEATLTFSDVEAVIVAHDETGKPLSPLDIIPASEDESTGFQTGESTISIEEAERIASVIRARGHAQHLAVLDAYVKHGSVRHAARWLGMPKSTFLDALRRARAEARQLVCPTPDSAN